jgi:predicted nucleotidyltransferase
MAAIVRTVTSAANSCNMPNMGCIVPFMGMSKQKRPGSLQKADPPSRVAGRTSIADALFKSTQQKVLRWLYGQPQRTYFANELIELTQSGSGAVQRELARLVESGLVTSHRFGRQRRFQANAEAPIFAELCRIVLKTVGAADPIRAALESLGGRISTAMIYGSVAKGSDTATSDIDLLVVSDHLTLEDLYVALDPVEQLLSRKINPTLISTVELQEKRKSAGSFLSRVLDGPTIVLIDHSTSGVT